MHRSWLRKTSGGSLYFSLACFRYVPTISEPDTGKRLSENKHTLHWLKAKICKSVEKNLYLSFIQSLIDTTQTFNMIYRWPSFGSPQNTLWLRISWETSAIFSPVPGWSLLHRCPRKVWEKAGERVSWWRHISRAWNTLGWGWAIFCGSVSIVVVVGAAIVGDVCSLIEGELSPKVG